MRDQAAFRALTPNADGTISIMISVAVAKEEANRLYAGVLSTNPREKKEINNV